MIPKLIAMDSSTLNGLAGDLCSPKSDIRRIGENFLAEIYKRGWIPVISFEHIIELLQHGNDQIISDRISMFSKFPQIAYVYDLQNSGIPGGIVDILALEVQTFLSNKTLDIFAIAESVRSQIFRYCEGKMITKRLKENEAIKQRHIQDIHPIEKLVSSISHIALKRIKNSATPTLAFLAVASGTEDADRLLSCLLPKAPVSLPER